MDYCDTNTTNHFIQVTYLLFSLLLIVTLGQLFFLLRFFARLARHPLLALPQKELSLFQLSLPQVSVVICAHNELPRLKKFLPGILAQQHPEFEVIIVNDRSTDASAAWLEAQMSIHSSLCVVTIDQTPEGWNAKKHALVQGVKTARYDVILLTDADCAVNSPHWIQHMCQPLLDPHIEIVLGFSPYFKHKGVLNWFIQYETFFTAIQYLSFALLGKAYMGVGRNLAYRRKLFANGEILERFKGITGGDDDLFINQVANAHNTSVCMHPEAHILSVPKTTWTDWYRQKLRHLSVGKLYQAKYQYLLGFLLFTQTLFWFLSILGTIFELYNSNEPIFEGIIFLFSLRMLVLLSIYNVIIRKLRIDVNVWWIPTLDFLYIFYIFIIGSLAISRKRIKWT
ncbi:glycosyltransferase [Microscilla marina]|uniref:Putative transmembrane glycosyltransferase n=1 Tax=Microscilla marina ATCC 23134 TaxID=313606 RepID=A1ZXQ8_MICM2|nr:glycosyltransferase [Microscilla marina]EAY24836.1 putative transmembrane glycosyltransferase [Microscilla marina ATCC 23134]